MSNTPSELERAEARVAESAARVFGHIQALKATVRQRGASPLVIGGLIAAVAAVGYVAVRRSSGLQVCPSPAPPAQDKFGSALKTVRLLAPWLGAVGSAVASLQKGQCASAPVTAQPQSAAQPHAAVASRADLARVSWFNQHRHMIAAAAQAWVDDYAASMGAALSYYTLFSLAPLLIIVIAVAGMVFGQDAAQGEIVAQLQGIMGADGAMAVEGMLNAAREPATSVGATVVGVTLLLLGATAIFAELQDALDRIWRVPAPQARSGIWHLLRTRLLSFGLVLGLGFMLVVSLVMSAALAALGKWWGGWFEGWHVFLEMLNFAVSFGIFTLLFAMIYKIMPRAKVPWRDVWTGAAVTALLFTIGKVLVGLYLGKSSLASGYGAAGSFVVLVAWVYYCAQIFLFGAEFTWVYANRHGLRPYSQKIGSLSGPTTSLLPLNGQTPLFTGRSASDFARNRVQGTRF
jgi:membrane protein